jgi:hypothetical protein
MTRRVPGLGVFGGTHHHRGAALCRAPPRSRDADRRARGSYRFDFGAPGPDPIRFRPAHRSIRRGHRRGRREGPPAPSRPGLGTRAGCLPTKLLERVAHGASRALPGRPLRGEIADGGHDTALVGRPDRDPSARQRDRFGNQVASAGERERKRRQPGDLAQHATDDLRPRLPRPQPPTDRPCRGQVWADD